MLLSLISFLFIEILAVVLPGPDFFIVMRSALRYGRLSGFIVALGISSGAVVIATSIVFLLDYLQENLLFIVHWISLFGGCYLLYLAYMCYCDSSRKITLDEDKTDLKSLSKVKLYLLGFFCNLTNPKAIIFFVSILPIFILKCHTFLCGLIIVLIVFWVSTIWFGIVSFLVGSNRVREMLLKYTHKLELLFALILAAFAVYLIFSFICKV